MLESYDWRGGRVVDCTGLENRSAGNRAEGSNPSLSAEQGEQHEVLSDYVPARE